MSIIHQELTVPFTAAAMFTLINNINDYKNFLPHCKNSRIIKIDNNNMKASLVIAKAIVQRTVMIFHRFQKDKLIEVWVVDKLFKRMQGYWRFEPIAENKECKLTLHLEYEFANSILAMTYGSVFDEITKTLAQSFIKRAEAIYGSSNDNV